MAQWLVETRATVRRKYMVEATNEKEAKEKSCLVTPDFEEDELEETIDIAKRPTLSVSPSMRGGTENAQ